MAERAIIACAILAAIAACAGARDAAPSGPHGARASADGRGGPSGDAGGGESAREVEVVAGASGEIRGSIREVGSVPGVAVFLRGGEIPELTARAGDDGVFFFGPVPAGDYELVVTAHDPDESRDEAAALATREVVVEADRATEIVVDVAGAL